MPRRANNHPKTIEAIHKESRKEECKPKVDTHNAIIEYSGVGGRETGTFITLLIEQQNPTSQLFSPGYEC